MQNYGQKSRVTVRGLLGREEVETEPASCLPSRALCITGLVDQCIAVCHYALLFVVAYWR